MHAAFFVYAFDYEEGVGSKEEYVDDTPFASRVRIWSISVHWSEQDGNLSFVLQSTQGLLTSWPTSKSNLSRAILMNLYKPLNFSVLHLKE